MSYLTDLQQHIASLTIDGRTFTAGQSLVIGVPPDTEGTDDLCIGLVDRSGPVDETYGRIYGRPNVTVVVRSPKMEWQIAHDVAEDLFRQLTRVANETLGATSFLRLEPIAWPGRLREDTKLRRDVTFEIGVWLDGI